MSVSAFAASINKSIKIDAGEESGGASSVNGSISVGDDAVVTGGLQTVNGSISVDSGARIKNAKTVNGRLRMAAGVTAGHLATVNGSVTVGEGASIKGGISAVNGGITVEEDAAVTGGLENVTGRIELTGTTIGGDVKTVTGDVNVENTVLQGDLVIEKPSFWGKSKRRKPRVVIGPGSRVEGTIVVEHEVELYISESAEVGHVEGVMSMDDAQRFSGKRP